MRDRPQIELDLLLAKLAGQARLLPALSARDAPTERARLIACVARGAPAEPAFGHRARPIAPSLGAALGQARSLAMRHSCAPELYLARLDELELELELLESLGDRRRVRPLAARLFGTGAQRVHGGEGPSLAELAARILADVSGAREEPTVPAQAVDPEALSLERLVRAVARSAGVPVQVRVDPRLVANAACGDRMIFLADRRFGRVESRRLAIHEALGHLVAAANGRTHSLRIFALGTAGSFADQEGLCIYLEEAAGLLDGYRLRTLAARVLATDAMHAGASFEELSRLLVDGHGFSAHEAVILAERAYRGGGAARDCVYLGGWQRVREAIAGGQIVLEDLWLGKVGIADAPSCRRLRDAGYIRPLVYRPSLERSLRATDSGTSCETSPPSLATSLTMFEAT